MYSIAISEFKAVCLRLLREVKQTGQSILVTRAGEPIAIISPPPTKTKRKSSFGVMKSRTEIHADLTQPLGPNDWEVYKG